MAPGEPQTNSQTNWYRTCKSKLECGDLDCICGACTSLCSDITDCREGASMCLAITDERADSFCEGAALQRPVCVQTCDDSSCPSGTTCKDGVCLIEPPPDEVVKVDLSERYQKLVGFGASLAFAERDIIGHDDQEKLYELLFRDLNINVIRLGNHYEAGRETNLELTVELLEALIERVGSEPTLLMTEGSPPAALKKNGAKACDGDEGSCTLATLDDDSFDYAGLAEHWRESLEAYAEVGIKPDYLSIQNNPNWSPPEGHSGDACRLLPTEGTTELNGKEIRLAGYLEAAQAVLDEIKDLPDPPRLYGPETTTLNAVPRYEPVLAEGLLAAVAIHMYGANVENPRRDEMNVVRALAAEYDLPVFQSEAMNEGLETATLIHTAMVEGNATVYLQNDFVSPVGALDPNQNAFIQLEEEGYTIQGPYYAMQHFSAHTGPGWTRVFAAAEKGGLLTSAWIAPDEEALTVVLVNTGTEPLVADLDLDEERKTLTSSSVTQTVYTPSLEHKNLGALPKDGRIEIPAQSTVTVALTKGS